MGKLGAVIIGRNEGERFIRCLDGLLARADSIVYVDSGSTDGSVAHARSKGVDVVALDRSVPFTAARARNAGFGQLRELEPDVARVMFVDGDCEVDPGWLPAANAFLDSHEEYGVVCGRRRERYPEATIYNYLCDVEWNTPVGDADACGGDALMRVDALASVSGFDPGLIAGEEPELCVRLRQKGWKVRRLDREMTLHDAALSRFSQWWTRAVRAGHAYAEGTAMHGAPPERHWVRETRRAVFWGLMLPAFSILVAPWTAGASLALFALYPANALRIALRLRKSGEPRPWTVATFMMIAKFPEARGWLRYKANRLKGSRTRLIEYKG
ncbi:MAG: glycosyltransferase [Polyangiales bacterium]